MIAPASILVIDDDPGTCQTVCDVLELRGHSVTTVTRGQSAFAVLAGSAVDIALVDLQLPDISGLDLLRSIKTSSPSTEVIIITGHASVPTAIQAINGTAFAYLTKPFEMDHLLAVVEKAREKQRLERALRDSEARYRESNQALQTLIDAAPVTIFALDENERVTLWNKAAERLWGWSAEEMLGQQARTVPDHKRAEFEEYSARNRQGESTLIETQRHRKDGSALDVLVSRAPILDPAGRVAGTMGVIVDITNLKQLEEQLRQSVKMEGIGRLAGGVAHDFNNLLTVIGGRAYLLLGQLPADHPMRRDIEIIEETARRAGALTRQLLAFSRKQVLAPVVLDLNDVVSGMQSLLERLLGEDVNLKIVMDPLAGRVTADPGQLEQVVVNLAVNARDAMPSGGRLTIETSNVVVDQAYVQQHVDVGPGLYVVLAVSDSGSGMDAATRARIFEPFFTTKEMGKGTGLGLSTVYGIIKQSNGHITVYSEPGSGTTFRIYLPATDADVTPAPTPLNVVPLGTETILLVEDEANIRELARELLQISGYTVLESTDVQDAVRIAEQHPAVIDLLITDVVMPQMGGRAVADAVKSLRPDIKVLYMSGYTDEAVVRHGVLSSGSSFLQKPFTPGGLARKVREVLDGTP